MSSNNLVVGDPTMTYASRRSTSSLSVSMASSAMSSKNQSSTFVIEIGNRLTRFGIAGEQTPRQVLRTEFRDVTQPTRTVPLYDPTQDPGEQERILTSYFNELTLGKMLKNPMNSRFIIVDSLFSTPEFRNLLARVLFKHKTLEVASISFVPAPLMNMVTVNAKTALLLDTGINECMLYPVFDRVVLFQEFDATPCSTATVENRIKDLMKIHGRVQNVDGSERELNETDWKLFDKLRCAEDICYRFCFATTRKRVSEMQDNKNFKYAPLVKITFGTELLIVSGIVRECAAEVVFSDDQYSRSIPQIIIEFIDRASIEVKKQYLGSILSVGGLSHMQGFQSRVREELEFLLGEYANGKYEGLKKNIGFYVNAELDSSSAKFCSAWIGASLISPFDLNQWYTRSEWLENMKVPDWTMDIDDYLNRLEIESYITSIEQPTSLEF